MPSLILPRRFNEKPAVNFVLSASARNGLVGFWPIIEGGGHTLRDYSGNNYHAIASSATPHWETGWHGACYHLGTAADWSTYLTSNVPYVSGQANTLVVRFKTTQANGGAFFAGSATDRYFYLGTDGKVYLALYSGAERYVISSKTYNDGKEHTAIGVYGTSSSYLYIDGEFIGSMAYAAPAYSGTYRFSYKTNSGSWTNSSTNYGYYGQLDELRVYNRELSVKEILNITFNPFDIWVPRKSVLYFGGGTPTNYPSAADSGSITLTGSAANGVRALAGVAASGSITLTGSAANAVRALAGVAASGSITLTGSNAAALRTWLGVAGAGSITLTGSDAVGVKAGSGAYTSAADAGSITLSGSAAVGTYDRLAAAGSGSITLTGSDASGIRNVPATAEAGGIVLTGSAAVGVRAWLAAAGSGSITLSGSDAEGVFGGAMTLTQADLDAIAAAMWADPAAVAAHAKLDEIIARITC